MNTLDVRGRAEWRAWLAENGTKYREIWLVYYKKDGHGQGISYDDSLDEALCFGWIDGKVRKLDEARYVRRFTPRKPDSFWSGSNIERVNRLKADGRMTASGLNVFRPGRRRDAGVMPKQLPKELEKQFKKNRDAWKNYKLFSPSYRRMTAAWVSSAKRDDTRLKRLEKLIAWSARNEKIDFV